MIKLIINLERELTALSSTGSLTSQFRYLIPLRLSSLDEVITVLLSKDCELHKSALKISNNFPYYTYKMYSSDYVYLHNCDTNGEY